MVLDKLKKNREFKTVYENGKSLANRYLVLYYYYNKSNKNRIGISISKKVGNAVTRNKIRRVLTEIIRLNINSLVSGYDLIIIVRPRFIKNADYKDIEKAYLNLIKKSGLLKEEDEIK